MKELHSGLFRWALMLSAVVQGCSSESSNPGDGPRPETPVVQEPLPQRITVVAEGDFVQPGDAVSGHDGRAVFFSAYRSIEGESQAAVFRASGPSPATPLHSGAPLGNPSGLVLSCDGATLYVADRRVEGSAEEDDRGGIFAIDTTTGALRALQAEGIGMPEGLALSVDCGTLYVSGWDASGTPALFTLAVEGGLAQVVLRGAPLVSPTGLHVDKDRVAWVLDHLARGQNGPGVLFAVDAAGNAREVISNLRMGTPGGVSLNSSGTTAFIPTLDNAGQAQLTAVALADGTITQIPAPGLTDPAGIRTARNASVFALVDAESGRIYRAQ